jgi:predicted O-linked N-acetylglucosamine transferase (SPINDLY family)
MAEDRLGAGSATPAIQSLMDEAARHWQAGELDRAAAIYKKVLKDDPRHGAANHGMGVVSVLGRRFDRALAYFEAALDAEPTDAGHWLSYIDALDRDGKTETALQILDLAARQGLAGPEVDALASRLTARRDEPAKKVGPVDSRKAGTTGKAAPAKREIDALMAMVTAGRLADAAAAALELTRQYPRHWLGWKTLGVVYQHLGRNAEALPCMERTVELLPSDAEAADNLGVVQQGLGRTAEAEASYRRAIAIAPGLARAHGNLAAVLLEAGRLTEAESACRRAIQLDSTYARAHNSLGVILQQSGRPDDAEAAFRRAIALKPDYDDPHVNLGALYKSRGLRAEAEASYLRALAINPVSSSALGNLSFLELEAKRFTAAEAYARRALQVLPHDVQLLNTLGIIQTGLGQFDAALETLTRARTLQPTWAPAHSSVGDALLRRGDIEAAIASYRQALELDPDLVIAHVNLAVALIELGRFAEAESSCRRAIALVPESWLAYNGLGLIALHALDHEMAIDCFRRAIEFNPAFAPAYSNLLFGLAKKPALGAQDLFAEHRRFGEHFESVSPGPCRNHGNDRDPDRPLRIGFVSGDLRDHAVAYFIEPVLAVLRDSRQLVLHAYSNHFISDDVSRRLRAMFAHWRDVGGLADDELASQIAADGIDILIDLSGHTARNRLPVFAAKPAPVQASWIGYPGTTGLRSMDYYLADRLFLPHERFAWQFTEKLVYLPTTVPFLPPADAPAVARLPAAESGFVTFGSFNRMNKITRDVVALWARLLRAQPDSRMLIAAVPDDFDDDLLIGWFAAEGVGRDRLDLRRRCKLASYLALHGEVDICLDTYPYTGGTTINHALWMGVPTLTLAGETPASWSGARIMGAVGLGEFVADGIDDFVAKGVAVTANRATLADIRSGLRQRFMDSNLGQTDLIAAAFLDAMRFMWRRWCAGLPAAAFEADGCGNMHLVPTAEVR